MRLHVLVVATLFGLSMAIVCPSATTFAQEGGNRGGAPSFMRAQIAFRIFDSNSDGALEESEVPGFVWERLSHADANEDGSVTREELKTMAATRLFGNFDENEDGSLTEDEVPAPVWRRLSSADSDKDGAVTQEEFLAAQQGQRGGSRSDG